MRDMERVVKNRIIPPQKNISTPFITSGEVAPFFRPKLSEEVKVQRTEDGAAPYVEAPSIVNDVIHSTGEPLDSTTQSFMADRFGYDFSNVKIHGNTLAAKSANAINALAYTSGNRIVFNEGQYAPNTDTGKKLLAHELTHVVQQNSNQVQQIQRQPAVTPRGTNPEDCIDSVCGGLNRARPPASVAAAQTMSDNWLSNMLSCLNTNAPTSNASHHQEITQNEDHELRDEASSQGNYFSHRRPSRSAYRDFIENIRRVCVRKKREIGIEFNYNIVFDNSGMTWGYHPSANWDAIDSAFATMPPEATWMSPRLLTFKREQVHATRLSVAGETDIPTGTITIFNSGFGSAPYTRSRATGIPSTTQTIQHEVGHIVTAAIPRNEYNNFFNSIVHWHKYPWAWITATNSSFPSWQAERNPLKTETGMNDQQLDAWLPTLPMETRLNRNGRSYFRSTNYLDAYDTDQVPDIPGFEYGGSGRNEYLSELYTFCIYNPEFVYRQLPSAQITWLKRVMFNFPTDPNEILRQYAIGEPQQTEFIRRIMRVFTWQQVNDVFNQIMLISPGSGNSAIA